MKYKIGDKVKVNINNDNECYNSFRDKVLIITHADNKGLGYDKSIFPQGLYCFKDENDEDIPCSLYDYELEEA